tara:strand:- start:184 stop:870 length:687 start_codon:yes stop_codon:yes gene_type:complete
MPTLNASKTGIGIGSSSTTFATARENGSTVMVNQTNQQDRAISYTGIAGRGALTHNMRRTFLYFDTSGLTGTISNTSLNIRGVTNDSADVIVLKSTAFGGDGSSNLNTSEFFSSIDYSTAYSSEYDSWTATGDNDISLNSTANTDIQNNNAFICAIVEHTNDFGNTAASSATQNNAGINFAVTITLTYTEAAASGPANLTSLNGIAKASITSANTITLANITSINTVS